jgi:transcriptional regulator with XRE-family HTH domain
MAGAGAKLRAIRQQWRLSLREVEQRSRRIAEERGNVSYQVSASWLARLESDEHELTVHKLIALAEIYSIPIEQLLRCNYPGKGEPLAIDQLPGPSATTFPMEGSQKSQANHLLSDTAFPNQTTLLPKKNAPFPTSYLRGIIGKLDLTLPREPSDLRKTRLRNWLDTRAVTEHCIVMHRIGQHIPAPNHVLQKQSGKLTL